MKSSASTRTVQGFTPSRAVRFQRRIARIILGVLRIHGRSRWSNEFVQVVEPAMRMTIPGLSNSSDDALWFRTGHGRLFWRVTETPSEEPETNAWIGTFDSGDVFFDVGANVGLYAMSEAKYRSVRTVAIEPDLMNARLLYENVLRNGIGDLVTVLPVAVDDASRVDRLHLKTLSYGDALHNLSEPSPYVAAPSGLTALVPVFALDDLVNQLGLPAPTRLKIDVDGREEHVLSGAERVLRTVWEVLVEVDLDRTSSARVNAMLTARGFDIVGESTPTVGWNRCVNRLFRRRVGAGSGRRSRS